ncbi:MAG: LCP family protein, partial [Anaerolineales bacterium]
MTTPTLKREPFLRRLATGFRGLDRLTKIILIAFLVAGLATALVGFNFVYRFVGCSPTGVFPGLLLSSCGGQTGLGGDRTVSSANQGELPVPESLEDIYTYSRPQHWDGSSRVNILVMGLDARDWEVGAGAPRTDTMIVLTFDPVSKSAGMLSIPRDMWVEIPGFGHGKINNAYALGE